LSNRSATVSVPELTADVTYEFTVTEALYAIDVSSKTEAVASEISSTGSIAIEFKKPEVIEEEEPAEEEDKNEEDESPVETPPEPVILDPEAEETDFGEIDDTLFETVEISIDDWARTKPQPKPPKVDLATGKVFIPPPVEVSEVIITESGGVALGFARNVIVPPFFTQRNESSKETYPVRCGRSTVS